MNAAPPTLRLKVLAGILVVCLVALAFRLVQVLGPKPPVPVPVNLAQLDPQLRDYLSNHVAWVEADPKDARKQATLGMVYAANALWKEARVAFSNAVHLDGSDPHAALYQAIATHESGDPQDALVQFRALAARVPSFAPARYRVADAALRLGNLDEAEAGFRALTNLAPAEWRGFAGLGDIALRKGRAADAVALLEKAVELDPGARIAHHLFGQALQGVGRTNEALRELAMGRDAQHFPMQDEWAAYAVLHMKSLPDQIDLAHQFMEADEPKKAVGVLAEALTYHPTNLAVIENLSMAQLHAGEPAQAKALLQKGLQFEPSHLNIHLLLSEACTALKQYDEGMGYLKRAMRLSTNNPAVHLAWANIHLAQGKDADAVAELNKACVADPRNAQLRLQVGDVLLQNLGKPAQAASAYEKARELDPGFLPAHYRLIQAQAMAGQTNDAWKSLNRLKSIAPRDETIPRLESRLRGGAPAQPRR